MPTNEHGEIYDGTTYHGAMKMALTNAMNLEIRINADDLERLESALNVNGWQKVLHERDDEIFSLRQVVASQERELREQREKLVARCEERDALRQMASEYKDTITNRDERIAELKERLDIAQKKNAEKPHEVSGVELPEEFTVSASEYAEFMTWCETNRSEKL